MTEMDYPLLASEYSDPQSLSYKKIRIVSGYIPPGGTYLDVGMGTGDLIALQAGKHAKIFGIDGNEHSVSLCRQKFGGDPDIGLFHGRIEDLQNICTEKFDCITCLDILEHIEEKEVIPALENIYRLMNDRGVFIFSGPGIFEKIRIACGRSPGHLHSHSSYGWMNVIRRAGFSVMSVQSVEFPVIHSTFLRKHVHLFGKCCIVVAEKKPSG
jgi:ubiquinone/menaquinone biosynthesis C-methylase UbiE